MRFKVEFEESKGINYEKLQIEVQKEIGRADKSNFEFRGDFLGSDEVYISDVDYT